MKRILLIVAFAMLLAIPAWGANLEAITVDNTAGGVALTTSYVDNSSMCFMTLETGQIRWTIDGTAPTTTVGHLLEIGQTLTFNSRQQCRGFRAIRTGTTSGALKVTYW